MELVSLRQKPEAKDEILKYVQKRWANENSMMVYEDCLNHCYGEENSLPQWYILKDGDKIVGCAGLITNDFISRMDLYPWVCALYIEEEYRGHAYGNLLLSKAKKDAKGGGYKHVYLCTDHIGYYEKFGFSFIGKGYHPWGESSRIYESQV